MIEGARPNGFLRRDREYVCTNAFRCLGRTYEKGQIFPHRRYRFHAPKLKRKGMIIEVGPSPVISAEGGPGEGPFKALHRGRGRWAVANAAGDAVSSTSTKADIEALIEQMNRPPDANEDPPLASDSDQESGSE